MLPRGWGFSPEPSPLGTPWTSPSSPMEGPGCPGIGLFYRHQAEETVAEEAPAYWSSWRKISISLKITRSGPETTEAGRTRRRTGILNGDKPLRRKAPTKPETSAGKKRRRENDCFGHSAPRPKGAGLRPSEIAPGDYREPSAGLIPLSR